LEQKRGVEDLPFVSRSPAGLGGIPERGGCTVTKKNREVLPSAPKCVEARELYNCRCATPRERIQDSTQGQIRSGWQEVMVKKSKGGGGSRTQRKTASTNNRGDIGTSKHGDLKSSSWGGNLKYKEKTTPNSFLILETQPEGGKKEVIHDRSLEGGMRASSHRKVTCHRDHKPKELAEAYRNQKQKGNIGDLEQRVGGNFRAGGGGGNAKDHDERTPGETWRRPTIGILAANVNKRIKELRGGQKKGHRRRTLSSKTTNILRRQQRMLEPSKEGEDT